MAESTEDREYFALVEIVDAADQRLLTIKGWGVTVSLAALGLAFQHRATGFFVVALLSSVCFWALEAVVKRHQMRYYPRMREIEARRYESAPDDEKPFTSPRIDWSWGTADRLLRSGAVTTLPINRRARSAAYGRMWLASHVALPHAITFLASAGFLILAACNKLPGFAIGAPPK